MDIPNQFKYLSPWELSHQNKCGCNLSDAKLLYDKRSETFYKIIAKFHPQRCQWSDHPPLPGRPSLVILHPIYTILPYFSGNRKNQNARHRHDNIRKKKCDYPEDMDVRRIIHHHDHKRQQYLRGRFKVGKHEQEPSSDGGAYQFVLNLHFLICQNFGGIQFLLHFFERI